MSRADRLNLDNYDPDSLCNHLRSARRRKKRSTGRMCSDATTFFGPVEEERRLWDEHYSNMERVRERTESLIKGAEIPTEVQQLLDERKAALDLKDFEKSDKLRDQIRDLGWEVRGEAENQEVRKL